MIAATPTANDHSRSRHEEVTVWFRDRAPRIVYRSLSGWNSSGEFEPARLRRKTLAEVSALLGLKTGRAVAILRRHGISGGPDDRLKDLAESNGKAPVELYELLQD